MSTLSASPAARMARRVFHGRNRLARARDRVEGAVVLVAVLVVLLGIPVAATVGSETYQAAVVESVAQSRTRHETTATLLEDVPAATAAGTPSHRAAATWDGPDGSHHRGPVVAAPYLKAGTRLAIWVDDAGRTTTPPLTVEGAVITAIGVAFLSWSALVFLMAGLCALTTYLNKKTSSRHWEAEWAATEPEWTGRRH